MTPSRISGDVSDDLLCAEWRELFDEDIFASLPIVWDVAATDDGTCVDLMLPLNVSDADDPVYRFSFADLVRENLLDDTFTDEIPPLIAMRDALRALCDEIDATIARRSRANERAS